MYCLWNPNLAELNKCRPMIVKQSRIQKMLRWLINESKNTKRYEATTEAEKHINRILAELQSVPDKIHGTTAQILDMRNGIRGYVNAFGMYTLFVTVNLADLHSPLMTRYLTALPGASRTKFLDQADAVWANDKKSPNRGHIHHT
ncbi:BZ3500_MvSof-1268-A1-R1_Chr6-3g08685 [Microbotryum saponariae]|uniref:BZ3500_MvSof-1268-A1-R1_Chr6-3g08685 protein n=1 Tax=Microbotryum saponariae TaxID=289078 RepID=A0A2X0MMB2_9BASI|nr:BZ3500_MvSof-1268-A1-R1_Chr6-3g08685 [Microbotryum saponariae]SDA07286.1 BZ3501_MvSof-1269-A2-R1_Chr6-2g08388 [Microbotryum saponariae]